MTYGGMGNPVTRGLLVQLRTDSYDRVLSSYSTVSKWFTRTPNPIIYHDDRTDMRQLLGLESSRRGALVGDHLFLYGPWNRHVSVLYSFLELRLWQRASSSTACELTRELYRSCVAYRILASLAIAAKRCDRQEEKREFEDDMLSFRRSIPFASMLTPTRDSF